MNTGPVLGWPRDCMWEVNLSLDCSRACGGISQGVGGRMTEQETFAERISHIPATLGEAMSPCGV